jgi:glutamate-1-semialdehyde 2,1-aminomutase
MYLERTPGSRQWAERAGNVFPSGVTHDSRYLEPYPLFVSRANGSRKWDVDGHEYVDYAGGHGALLLGHNHPVVTEAVAEQLSRGTHYGACHELEVRWGELVQKLVPSAERVRFTASGTEATMLALRLARAHTGKTKVVRFLGHFHGWHDHMAFGVTSHFDGTPTPGVLPNIAEQIVLVPPGDVEATKRALDAGDVAAVIIEPTGASWGQVPVAREFLAALRKLTAERGVVLVFDEVISGFRCSPGGAQESLGITPDMTTLAKIIAGGFPGGAVVGRKEILDGLDFAASGVAGREKVPHQGTFNANPISAAAGIATLEIVASTDACQKASDFAARVRGELNRVCAEESVNWAVYGSFSGFHIFTNPNNLSISPADIDAGRYDYRTLKDVNKSLVMKLRVGMVVHGVEIFGWPGGPTSAVHTDDDLQRTAQAFRATLRMLKEEGEIKG